MKKRNLCGFLTIDGEKRPKVKICGINTTEAVNRCVSLGADALGFLVRKEASVSEPVGHRISVETVANLVAHIPSHVSSILLIHVEKVQDILDLCQRIKPDALQIQIEVTLEIVSKVRRTFPSIGIIRTLHIYPEALKDEVISSALTLANSNLFDAILLDSRLSKKSRRTGGTGLVHDWTISSAIVERLEGFPVILAGGLRPDNVRAAIATVRPHAVDVMTGVEIAKGVKDYSKVGAFINSVRAASN